MIPRKKKILKDLEELATTNYEVHERCKAIATNPALSPTERQTAAYVAQDALIQARGYSNTADQFRAGLIGTDHPEIRGLYR